MDFAALVATLTLARVDRLEGEGFAQTTIETWRAARGRLGPQTCNAGAGLEAIDLFGPRSQAGAG